MFLMRAYVAVREGGVGRATSRISASAGTSAAWQGFHVVRDQHEALRQDVAAVRSHPLISGRADVGGFVYDVDTGLLATLD